MRLILPFNQWKRKFANNAAFSFDKENKELQVQDNETLLQALYAQIGQLKVETNFLKKNCSNAIT